AEGTHRVPAGFLLTPLGDVPSVGRGDDDPMHCLSRTLNRLLEDGTELLIAPDAIEVDALLGNEAQVGNRIGHDVCPVTPEALKSYKSFRLTVQDATRY